MSYTELHIGKLKEVKIIGPLEEWCQNFCKRFEKELQSYNNNWKEQFIDDFSDRYFIYKDRVFEFVEHTEYEDYEDITFAQEKNGEISFITQHYNGGASFEEVLEEALDKIKI